MSDYYMGIDASGQPYIAHWGNWKNKSHKYLDKVKTAAGNWRYIYNKKVEETKKSFNRIVGKDAKAKYERAKKDYDHEMKTMGRDQKNAERSKMLAEAEYHRTLLGKGEKFLSRMKNYRDAKLSQIHAEDVNWKGMLTSKQGWKTETHIRTGFLGIPIGVLKTGQHYSETRSNKEKNDASLVKDPSKTSISKMTPWERNATIDHRFRDSKYWR